MKSMQEKVEQRVKAFLEMVLPEPGRHIICAYSGGPDSSVLLYLLKRFAGDYSYTLSAAYINHNIRSNEEMKKESDHIYGFTGQLDVPLYYKEFPGGFIQYYSEKTGSGLEGAARNCRYHFFTKLSSFRENTFIALGHNRNDQIETLLMRIFQGTGFDGMKGIPAVNGNLIRPLLGVSREEILSYAAFRSIPYITDSTNLTGDYRRNRIRRELIPVLKNIFPDPESALMQITADISALGKFALSDLEWERYKDTWRFRAERFFSLPRSVRKSFVLNKMNILNKGVLPKDMRIPGRFFNPIMENPDPKAGDRILLSGYRIQFERKGEWVSLKIADHFCTGGVFHLLEKDNPFVSEYFTLHLRKEGHFKKAYWVPFSLLISVRRNDGGHFRIYNGSQKILELDSWGNESFFLYGKEKICQNVRPGEKDCVIIEVEVKYAPG